MSENVPGEKLFAPEKQRAIDALLCTGDVSEAARQSGVSERTINRWRREPAFFAALQSAQAAALDQTAAALVGASVVSVALLRKTVENEAAKLNTRIRAASVLLDMTLRWRDRDVERRLTALEAQNAK